MYRDIWINELELWAVLLQVRMMAPRVRGMTYHLWCDNMGVVYMINKLGTRSERCSRLVAELIWIAVVYDIELAVRHVPTHENVLADAGTRQHDKEFRGLARQYLSDHPRGWLEWERRPEALAGTAAGAAGVTAAGAGGTRGCAGYDGGRRRRTRPIAAGVHETGGGSAA